MSCAAVFSAVTAWSHRFVAHRRRGSVAPSVTRAAFVDRCCGNYGCRQLWGRTCAGVWCTVSNIFFSQDWWTSSADLHVSFLHLTLLCAKRHGMVEIIFTSAKEEIMLSDRFVCRSVCVQDYCKSNEPISLKLGVMIGPISRKNWLTFICDPVTDTDSWLLFHFPYHFRIGDFGGFISISHTVTGWFSLCKMTDVDKIINPQHFGSSQADIRIRIRFNLEIQIRIWDHFWLRWDALPEVCALWAQSSCCLVVTVFI